MIIVEGELAAFDHGVVCCGKGVATALFAAAILAIAAVATWVFA